MPSIIPNDMLNNRVDLYAFTPSQDADGAVQGDDSAYPFPFATNVRCSVQPEKPSRLTDQERISGMMVWNVYFAINPGIGVNDRIVWVDDANVTHKLVVVLSRNLGGVSGGWHTRCQEKV